MISLIFLFMVTLVGYFILSRFLTISDLFIKLIVSFMIGSLLSVSLIYFLASYATFSFSQSFYFFFIGSFLTATICYKRYKLKFFSIITVLEAFVLCFIFLASLYLFSKGFGYDPVNSQFLIASNTYLDFGVHVPLIRSFSLGYNFPMEIPFFSGKYVFYHFMFDLYVGILEYTGMRIDHAFNLLSAITFTGLLIMIYKLSILIFNRVSIGLLAVIFFLLQGGLSVLEFFQKYGFSFSSLWHNSFYGESGPLGSKTIGVFWTLNTYLNQRQLIFGILFIMFFLYILLQKYHLSKKQLFFLGGLIGLLPFWHTTMFLSIYLLCFGFWIFMPKIRRNVVMVSIISLIFAIPALLLISTNASHPIVFKPGFLVSEILSVKNLFLYWIWNLGFLLPTIVFGFIISSKSQKQFFLSTLPLFLVPNLFQISSDMYDNHKFLNLWMILAIPFSALTIVWLFKKRMIFKLVSFALCVGILSSGVLNFMVVKNDVRAQVDDYPKEKITQFMYGYIPHGVVVLSNGEIYDPLPIMGKKTYLGRSYYIYTYGANPYEREEGVRMILQSTDILAVKSFLKEENISYIVLYKGGFVKNPKVFNEAIFRKYFGIIYEDINGIIIKI